MSHNQNESIIIVDSSLQEEEISSTPPSHAFRQHHDETELVRSQLASVSPSTATFDAAEKVSFTCDQEGLLLHKNTQQPPTVGVLVHAHDMLRRRSKWHRFVFCCILLIAVVVVARSGALQTMVEREQQDAAVEEDHHLFRRRDAADSWDHDMASYGKSNGRNRKDAAMRRSHNNEFEDPRRGGHHHHHLRPVSGDKEDHPRGMRHVYKAIQRAHKWCVQRLRSPSLSKSVPATLDEESTLRLLLLLQRLFVSDRQRRSRDRVHQKLLQIGVGRGGLPGAAPPLYRDASEWLAHLTGGDHYEYRLSIQWQEELLQAVQKDDDKQEHEEKDYRSGEVLLGDDEASSPRFLLRIAKDHWQCHNATGACLSRPSRRDDEAEQEEEMEDNAVEVEDSLHGTGVDSNEEALRKDEDDDTDENLMGKDGDKHPHFHKHKHNHARGSHSKTNGFFGWLRFSRSHHSLSGDDATSNSHSLSHHHNHHHDHRPSEPFDKEANDEESFATRKPKKARASSWLHWLRSHFGSHSHSHSPSFSGEATRSQDDIKEAQHHTATVLRATSLSQAMKKRGHRRASNPPTSSSFPPFAAALSSYRYLCLDGSSVNGLDRCDGFEDCPDGSDEILCHTPNYPIADAFASEELIQRDTMLLQELAAAAAADAALSSSRNEEEESAVSGSGTTGASSGLPPLPPPSTSPSSSFASHSLSSYSALHMRARVRHEARTLFAAATCNGCACWVSGSMVNSGNPWFEMGIVSKMTPDFSAMQPSGKRCHPENTAALHIELYKKTGFCRKAICCIRQSDCVKCHLDNVTAHPGKCWEKLENVTEAASHTTTTPTTATLAPSN